MSDRIKAGLVGYGYWGPVLARNLSSSHHYELGWIADLSEKNLSNAAGLYPGTKTVAAYQEILQDADVKLIVIATPVEGHYEIAKAALMAGKHVLVEKPMASTVAECEELVALAKEKGLTLAVDHTFLFTPAVRKMHQWIEDGTIGDVYFIDSDRINLGLIQQKANVFWDLAVHDLSIVTYLFGGEQPLSVVAKGERYTQEDQDEIGMLMLTYPNKKTVSVTVSWLSPVKLRRMIVTGSKQMVYYDDISADEKLRLIDKGVDYDPSADKPFSPMYRSGDALIPRLNNREAIGLELEELHASITNGTPLVSSGEDGLKVVRVLAAIDESLKTGKEITL